MPLRALVESQLEPFGRERIAIAGPDVRLTSDAANYLALALHELATNAAKYGALSTATGQVELHWGIEEGARRFQMSWRESGGPGVAPPARSGFGSKVMTTLAESAINARAAVSYPPDGAHWALDAPLGRVLDADCRSAGARAEGTGP